MLIREFLFAGTVSLLALGLATLYGFNTGGLSVAISFLFITAILGVMELSLSFDNAVVNATVLRNMTPLWQTRFLTWGILIAVFGMRFFFPLAIVSIVAGIGLLDVTRLAFADPEAYSSYLKSAHVPISAFGGCFLMLVFLKYLLDPEKDTHWLAWLEKRLALVGRLDTIQVFLTGLILLLTVGFLLPEEEQLGALIAGLWGILVYILIDAVGGLFNAEAIAEQAHRAGFVSFIYLEVLDASFSFDGVIGAFAITKDIVVIAAGLAIGAVFVRSLTLLLVKRGTLQQYIYLEHGAHYGIGALAVIMLLSMSESVHVPEVVTALIGLGFICASLWSSIQYQKNRPQGAA